MKGARVTIVGLGKSGASAARLCLKAGAKVRALDEKPALPSAEPLRAQGAQVELGGVPDDLAKDCDLLVVSPGVPLALPQIRAARAKGVEVIGEIELAWRMLEPWGPKVLAITGTNGKSTTTALTGELLQRAFGRVFVGGNLGRPWTEAAMADPPYALHVVELSSFQLEGIDRARFSGAALLNLSPDHLDRYESLKAYAEAKSRIFLNQRGEDFAVVNASDEQVVALARPHRAPIYAFAKSPVSGFRGLAIAEGSGFRLDFGGRVHFEVTSRALRGEHNLENAMAASLLARLSGVPDEVIQAGLDGFAGLPHRLESVRLLEGVEWVNDSKATNVDSALVALKAFSGRVWLIAGGKGKGAPYQPLVEAARGKVLGVLTIGQDAPAIERAFRGVLPVHPCETLENAVARARQLAREGDTVLLSPACASYDQFQNFEDRGDTFKRLVRAL